MKITQEGIELIKSFEGCRLIAYKCPAGVWTIGYGHTDGVREGMVISNAQAELMLRVDLEKFEQYVKDNVHIPLNENQFSALVSFCYNCGVGNLRKLVKGRNAEQIAEALLLYNKANGKTLAGLVRRRKAERELFLKPSAESTMKSVDEIAREIIEGKWGVGAERKRRLTQASYDYSVVQKRVNELLKIKSTEEIAREVIAGKWGTGNNRKILLAKAGYNPTEVQKKVNEILRGE